MKRMLSLVLILALCLSLCACGGKEASAEAQTKEETITVHAQVPADWADPGCWAWSMPDARDAFAQWPGEAMTKNGDWYVVEVPNWINFFIVNGNGGTVQTADLPVEAGKDLWVIVESPETAKVSYEEPAAVEETLPPTQPLSPEELFATVGTLNADQITELKVLPYVYRIKDGAELSREIDLSLLPEALTASAPEEVRYLVHFQYRATRASFYIGNLNVYNTSIVAEIQDVISGERLAEKTFYGAELPESVTSNTMDYYADYPDEAEVVEWLCQQITAIQSTEIAGKKAASEERLAEALSLAQSITDTGCFSYSGLIESLMDQELSGFTYEEAVYAADNCGADWFEEAAESAARYVGWGIEEREMLISMLEEDGFTHEQAVYGAENSGL